MQDVEPPGERTAPVWSIELVVAAVLALVGAVVVYDSRRVGAGWAAEGPQAGFFPFYVGLILVLASAWTVFTDLRPAKRDDGNFVERSSLGRVMALLAPAIVFVVVAPWLGLYVASVLLIAFFMRVLGDFSLLRSLATGLAIAVVLFAIFELWFVLPLPKGPLEAAIGF